MIQPIRLFANFFEDEAIINYRITNFGDNAVVRLTNANTSNQYDAIIADITAKSTALRNSLGQLLTDIAEQKGATYSVDQVMEAFLNQVSYKRGMVRDLYRTNEAAYLAFYPQGMKDYKEANKANVLALMQRYSNAATAHAADFDPAFVALFNGFPSAFTSAQNAQTGEKADVSSGRSVIDTQRQELNVALYRAVHFAAYYVNGDWENFSELFEFSRLFPTGHSAPREKFSGVLLPNSSAVAIHDVFPDGSKFKVRNLGTVELKIATRNMNDPAGLVWKTIKPGKTKTYTKAQLFSHPDDTYVLLLNQDLNDHLPWQMEWWVEEE